MVDVYSKKSCHAITDTGLKRMKKNLFDKTSLPLNLFTKNISTRGRLIFIQITCVLQQTYLHAEHLFNSNQKEMPMNFLVTYFSFLFENVFIHLSR